jgi:hypothetical protein
MPFRSFVFFALTLLCRCSSEKQTQDLRVGTYSESVNFLEIDSTFLEQVDTSQKLSYQFIRNLNGKQIDIECSTFLQSFLHNFCFIDSLRSAGAYNQYLDSIDIGMVREAQAFKLDEKKVGNQQLLIWCLEMISYEACPVFGGRMVLATYGHHGNYTNIPLGMNYAVADPPFFLSANVYSRLQGDSLFLSSVETSENDEDSVPQKKEYSATLHLKMNGEVNVYKN